ncbi:hypothetical protein [Chitinasiproducens palmae]|uniref:Lipoprotein n=1 Tax=Chitinasiproducens palmae TaxID=1770053 RepID=A0A1H2PU10_9BURK|nr:hypothetical protein [Chitinasiproducens palmae]SDV50614.1 hypothetical protein SAMN05216551_112129 [Chitinasiproducens palmae]
MSKSAWVFALLAGCAAGHTAIAASSNQFDLVCKGQEQKATGKPATPWSERFRVDLDARRWCRGACKTAAEIGSISADAIVLPDSRASIGGPADAEATLSRTDGKIKEYVYMGWSNSTATLAEGTCTREYFSGLPSQRF